MSELKRPLTPIPAREGTPQRQSQVFRRKKTEPKRKRELEGVENPSKTDPPKKIKPQEEAAPGPTIRTIERKKKGKGESPLSWRALHILLKRAGVSRASKGVYNDLLIISENYTLNLVYHTYLWASADDKLTLMKEYLQMVMESNGFYISINDYDIQQCPDTGGYDKKGNMMVENSPKRKYVANDSSQIEKSEKKREKLRELAIKRNKKIIEEEAKKLKGKKKIEYETLDDEEKKEEADQNLLRRSPVYKKKLKTGLESVEKTDCFAIPRKSFERFVKETILDKHFNFKNDLNLLNISDKEHFKEMLKVKGNSERSRLKVSAKFLFFAQLLLEKYLSQIARVSYKSLEYQKRMTLTTDSLWQALGQMSECHALTFTC